MTAHDSEHSDDPRPDGSGATAPEATLAGATGAGRSSGETTERDDEVDSAARAELLAEENRRLREEYVRARQTRYRRTAYGLAAVGCLAILGGVVFPADRETLFALGATGLFGGVLTLYLTPATFVAADIGERVYTALATNQRAIVDELGLSGEQVYVPWGTTVRLYVPQQPGLEPPGDHDGPVLVDDAHRGLLLETTGALLFEEFERAMTGDPAETPAPLAVQLADGVVEQFELASAVGSDVDDEECRATFEVSGSAFGDLDRFDHPIVSFLATGVALALERPVTVDVDAADGTDWLVTCRWDPAESPDPDSPS